MEQEHPFPTPFIAWGVAAWTREEHGEVQAPFLGVHGKDTDAALVLVVRYLGEAT